MRSTDATADVIVIGGGVIGLAIAAMAADRGLTVALYSAERRGAASRAAAGLLVPHYSGEDADSSTMRFMTASRDAYPAYLRWIADRSGVRVPTISSGAVEIASTEPERERLWTGAPAGSERLTTRAVAELEPALAPCAGGLLHPKDGAVDNVSLVDALSAIAEADARIRVWHEPAAEVRLRRDAPDVVSTVSTEGTRSQGRYVVLAAGAWAPQIGGLPRPLPVRPLRGQICVIRTAPLAHVVLERDVYLVARGADRTLVGSTMEDVGFDAVTTPEALEGLRRAAGAVCPPLATQPVAASWSGLRPATPDLLPVLGADPDEPRLIYACGHSRNGILLAPLTASVTTALVVGEDPGRDLTPFSIRRFQAAT
jgi:glycine oxidase ThiO